MLLRGPAAVGIYLLAAFLSAAATDPPIADAPPVAETDAAFANASFANGSLPFFLTPAERQSQSAACSFCKSKCPSLDWSSKRATRCIDARKRLVALKLAVRADGYYKQRGYFRAVMRTCLKKYCQRITMRDSCGLFKTRRDWGVLRAAFDEEHKTTKRAREQWERHVRPKSRYPDYMQRRTAVRRHREDAEHVRGIALSAHRDYIKWSQYLESTEFLRKERDLFKWEEEQKMYGVAFNFWRRLRQRVTLALKTSPQPVRLLAEETRRTARMMLSERADTAKRRKNTIKIENDEGRWVQERDVLYQKISEMEALTKELQEDRIFFHRVGSRVRSFAQAYPRRCEEEARQGQLQGRRARGHHLAVHQGMTGFDFCKGTLFYTVGEP